MAISNLALFHLVGTETGVYKKGEISFRENHVISFSFKPANEASISGSVLPSQKKGLYQVNMVISNDGEHVISKNCTCARGKSFCHHMVALGLYAIHNLSRTDVPCKWTQQKPADEVLSVKELFPSQQFRPNSTLSKEVIRRDLLQHCPDSAFAWIISEEPPEEDLNIGHNTVNTIQFKISKH